MPFPKTKTKAKDAKKLVTLCTTAEVTLAEGSNVSVIELLRVGTIRDRDLNVTADMLEGHVKNFEAGTYGVDLQVNLGHFREGEAAGWFKSVYTEVVDGVLTEFAQVEWNEMGAEKISKKLYKYISAEFAYEYQDDATGEWRNHVLIGAALTNIPAMKRQKPVSLSEEELTLKSLMLKQVIANLKKRTSLSVEDVKLARQLFSESSEEDQEATKTDVEDLEKKAKEQAEADEAAATAKKAEDEAKAKEGLSENGKTVSLAEFNAMKQKLERSELSEEVNKSLMLSESNPTGFRSEALGEVVNFMLSLSAAQRESFKTLMTKATSVDFAEHGASGEDVEAPASVSLASTDEDKVVALAEKYMKEGASVADAQRRAYSEVKASKK